MVIEYMVIEYYQSQPYLGQIVSKPLGDVCVLVVVRAPSDSFCTRQSRRPRPTFHVKGQNRKKDINIILDIQFYYRFKSI